MRTLQRLQTSKQPLKMGVLLLPGPTYRRYTTLDLQLVAEPSQLIGGLLSTP